jgi:hypothetical protein
LVKNLVNAVPNPEHGNEKAPSEFGGAFRIHFYGHRGKARHQAKKDRDVAISGSFALAEGAKGRDHYRQASPVKLIMQITEPYHGANLRSRMWLRRHGRSVRCGFFNCKLMKSNDLCDTEAWGFLGVLVFCT